MNRSIVKIKRVSGSIAIGTARVNLALRTPLQLTQAPYKYIILDLSDPLHGCPSCHGAWACNTSSDAISDRVAKRRNNFQVTTEEFTFTCWTPPNYALTYKLYGICATKPHAKLRSCASVCGDWCRLLVDCSRGCPAMLRFVTTGVAFSLEV